MKHIISATNRPGANSLVVARIIQQIYQETLKTSVEIISLQDIPFQQLLKNPYPKVLPPGVGQVVQTLNQSEGWTIVCPEYNGSFPGIFKFFIDHWSYPETFEFRPMAFVGLGGRFGGLRAVEQLQQIMGYRNACIYPERVFLQNISNLLVNGRIENQALLDLLNQQAKGFLAFLSKSKSLKPST